MTLQELMQCFLDDVCAGKSNETPSAYRSKLKRLMNDVGAQSSCRKLNPERLAQFDRGLRRASLSPFTVKSTLMSVQCFVRWAARHKHLHKDLAQWHAPKIKTQVVPKAVSELTFDRLIEAAQKHSQGEREIKRNIALFYFLRDTGGRIGEILHINIGDFDAKTRRLETVGKGDMARTLYVSAPTIKAVNAYLVVRHEFDPDNEGLFVGRFGDRLTRQGVYAVIRRLCKKANIQDRCNPHSFRHAFARDALRAGADLSRVSRMLGHSDIRVTHDYYARWNDQELQSCHANYGPGRLLAYPDV